MGIVKPKEKSLAWKITVETSILANLKIINMSPSSSGSPGRSQSRSPAAKKVQEPGLISQCVNDLEIEVEIHGEHQALSPARGVLLQDLTTGVICQGRTAGTRIQDYLRGGCQGLSGHSGWLPELVW